MRIYLSCLQSTRAHRIPAYQFWERYFKRGIEEAGHTWIESPGLDWAEGLACPDAASLAAWRERAWTVALEDIGRALQTGPLDLFLGYLYPGMVDPAAIREIRRRGVACVNFFCDNVRELDAVPDSFAAFDLHWVPELEATPMYERARCSYFVAPMPCWIDPRHRRHDHTETHGVSFVGSRDALRAGLLGQALALGAPIDIAGTGWDDAGSAGDPVRAPLRRTAANQAAFIRSHGLAAFCRKVADRIAPPKAPEIPTARLSGKLSDHDYVEWTQRSAVTLGINRVSTARRGLRAPFVYSRLRDIEAPMMGACYLTEWSPGVGAFYEAGVDIETYRTADELAGKIRELLGDAPRRRRLRAAGQVRALNELSVAASLGKAARALGIAAPVTAA